MMKMEILKFINEEIESILSELEKTDVNSQKRELSIRFIEAEYILKSIKKIKVKTMNKKTKELIDIITKYKIKACDFDSDIEKEIMDNIKNVYDKDVTKMSYDSSIDWIKHFDRKHNYYAGIDKGLEIAREILFKNGELSEEQIEKEFKYTIRQVNFGDKPLDR